VRNNAASGVSATFPVICGVAAVISIGWCFDQLPDAPRTLATPPPVEPATDLIAGRSLDEWRELMKSVPVDDPERSQFVPALTQIVQSPQFPWFTRRQAALTLGRWGSAAVDAVPFLEALIEESETHPEEATTLWALKGLSLFGPYAASAGRTVATVVVDANQPEAHRLAAMECLSQIGDAYPAGTAPLIQIAQNSTENGVLQRGAVEALGLFRGGASIAIPALLRCLDDPDDDIRREAAASLGRQGPAAEIAQPALLDLLTGDADPGVRDAAGVALAQTGPAVLPSVITLLHVDDAELRLRAARIVGQLGRRATSAAPELRPLWDDPDAAVRLAALESYWKTTGDGGTVAPRIAELLTSDERNLRRQAYLLLNTLGAALRSADPVLQRQLDHPRAEVRSVARKLLSLQSAR